MTRSTSLNWKYLSEVVGVAAIVASLVFVGLEMRQSRLLSRAQLTAETFNYIETVNQSLLDPSFSPIYVKMQDADSVFGPDEAVRANAFLEQVLQVGVRECTLAFGNFVFIECEDIPTELFVLHFSNPYTAKWWDIRRNGLHPFLVRTVGPMVDSALEQSGKELIFELSDDR